MASIKLILLIFAFVLFAVAAIWNPNPAPRWNLVAAGLACWVGASIFG